MTITAWTVTNPEPRFQTVSESNVERDDDLMPSLATSILVQSQIESARLPSHKVNKMEKIRTVMSSEQAGPRIFKSSYKSSFIQLGGTTLASQRHRHPTTHPC